ncbi:MAG TPA: hypothetical protein VFO32_08760, partial [Sphingomicrobium sp.]|nr:hypothetical protein [Sphingomicrobium sp.]
MSALGEVGVPEIAVAEIVVQVAQEDRRAALHVVPQRLPFVGAGRGGSNQAGDRAGRRLLARDVGPVQHTEIAQPRVGAGLGMGRRLQPDGGAEMRAVAQRQVQHGTAADRAAHDDGPRQAERARHGHHGVDIELGGELVGLGLEARRRRGFAMPRQIEGDDAEARGDGRIVQQLAILPAVGAGGVQAEQGNALPRLLEIEAMRPAVQIQPQIAADHRLDDRCAHGRRFRGRRCRPQRGQQLL